MSTSHAEAHEGPSELLGLVQGLRAPAAVEYSQRGPAVVLAVNGILSTRESRPAFLDKCVQCAQHWGFIVTDDAYKLVENHTLKLSRLVRGSEVPEGSSSDSEGSSSSDSPEVQQLIKMVDASLQTPEHLLQADNKNMPAQGLLLAAVEVPLKGWVPLKGCAEEVGKRLREEISSFHQLWPDRTVLVFTHSHGAWAAHSMLEAAKAGDPLLNNSKLVIITLGSPVFTGQEILSNFPNLRCFQYRTSKDDIPWFQRVLQPPTEVPRQDIVGEGGHDSIAYIDLIRNYQPLTQKL